MKIIELLGFIVLSFIICLVLVLFVIGFKFNIVSNISGDKIKEIEMGMNFEQLISILGKPYEIDVAGATHNINCKNPKFYFEMPVNKNMDIIEIVDGIYTDTSYCCDAYKEDIQKSKGITLAYTKNPSFLISFFSSYPILWVNLDRSYHVRGVFAKRYNFPDNVSRIYSLSWKTDTTTFEKIPDEVDFFINEELFNKCFK